MPPSTCSAWRPSFFWSHCTNVQSLKPTVPLPAIFAIWLQGPQKAQFTNRTLPMFVGSTRTIVGSGPWNETNSPLEISNPIGAQFSATSAV